MAKDLKFNSAICTSRSQSERLLALGLKKETADCHWFYHNEHWEIKIGFDLISCENLYPKYYIPAWSLHRLIEMVADTPLQVGSQVGMYVEDTYDMVIQGIEWLISRGQFNKDYLEEKK